MLPVSEINTETEESFTAELCLNCSKISTDWDEGSVSLGTKEKKMIMLSASHRIVTVC